MDSLQNICLKLFRGILNKRFFIPVSTKILIDLRKDPKLTFDLTDHKLLIKGKLWVVPNIDSLCGIPKLYLDLIIYSYIETDSQLCNTAFFLQLSTLSLVHKISCLVWDNTRVTKLHFDRTHYMPSPRICSIGNYTPLYYRSAGWVIRTFQGNHICEYTGFAISTKLFWIIEEKFRDLAKVLYGGDNFYSPVCCTYCFKWELN